MEQDTEKLVGHVELSSLISSTEFQALESQFNRFCPFEAVGMVRAEIRHSNFLGYVLNPFRPHGFGIALLRAFLVSALGDSFSAEIGTEAMREAEIRREWRNIDLLVLLPRAKCVVVVELKIDAPQSADQLTRYRKIVEATWPTPDWKREYLFLTKHDETPNDKNWREFKLYDLVEAFTNVVNGAEYHEAQAFGMLRSYIHMMRRHHLGNKDTENLARELWSKHGDTLAFLMDRRPDPLQEIFNQIRDDNLAFLEGISPQGVSVVRDRHSKRILRYAFEPWDRLTSFQTARKWTSTNRLVLLEIHLEEERIRAFLMLGPGTTPHRDEYAAALQSTGRGQYSSIAEVELAVLTPEGDVSFEEVLKEMAKFTNSVFNKFNPIMMRTSIRLQD